MLNDLFLKLSDSVILLMPSVVKMPIPLTSSAHPLTMSFSSLLILLRIRALLCPLEPLHWTKDERAGF